MRVKNLVGILDVDTNYFTRSTSGTLQITGVGFKPKVILFYARDNDTAQMNLSLGWSDGSNNTVLFGGVGWTEINASSTKCIFVKRDAANKLTGDVTSMDNDGFTLSFSLTGAQPIYCVYLALK